MSTPSSNLTPEQNADAGYQWYLENIEDILAPRTRLQILNDLETDLSLPPGTAFRFESLYSNAIAVCPHEDELYAVTWDSFHLALDTDPNLAILAHNYRLTSTVPLHELINDHGTFIF